MQFDQLKRREFITLLGGAAAAWPLAAHAQALKHIPRLCFLTFDPGTLQSNRFDAFFQGLRDLGYANGQSIAIDYLSAAGDGERFPALAAEWLRLKADVIAVSTTPAAQAAMAATSTIPIIMIALGDPVRTGLVNSLAQPGGNVTGLSLMVPEVAAKRLGLLKEAIPGISRVLVLTYLADPIAPLQVKALEEVAGSIGVTLQVHDIHTADDLPAAFDTAAKEHAELSRSHSARRELRRPNIEGSQGFQSSGRAADQVRVQPQPQDREDARLDNSARRARHRRQGDRVSCHGRCAPEWMKLRMLALDSKEFSDRVSS